MSLKSLFMHNSETPFIGKLHIVFSKLMEDILKDKLKKTSGNLFNILRHVFFQTNKCCQHF